MVLVGAPSRITGEGQNLQILLEFNVFVDRQKGLEPSLAGGVKQRAVGELVPMHLAGGAHFVRGEVAAKSTGNIVIQ